MSASSWMRRCRTDGAAVSHCERVGAHGQIQSLRQPPRPAQPTNSRLQQLRRTHAPRGGQPSAWPAAPPSLRRPQLRRGHPLRHCHCRHHRRFRRHWPSPLRSQTPPAALHPCRPRQTWLTGGCQHHWPLRWRPGGPPGPLSRLKSPGSPCGHPHPASSHQGPTAARRRPRARPRPPLEARRRALRRPPPHVYRGRAGPPPPPSRLHTHPTRALAAWPKRPPPQLAPAQPPPSQQQPHGQQPVRPYQGSSAAGWRRGWWPPHV